MQQKVVDLEEQEEPPGCRPSAFPFPFPSQPPSRTFRQRHFPSATDDDWHDWRWQLRNRITSLKKLGKLIDLSDSERQAMAFNGATLPLAITPYYVGLISPDDPKQPLRRTMVPTVNELLVSQGEEHDPLGEENHSPVPGLVHRYPDRVLFLVTDYCSSYCRYCTRSRMVGRRKNHSPARWQKAIAYIAANPGIRDVLLSGGDPLTMADEQLDWLLGRLRQIPHVEMIRIGTKAPMVLPQRITPELVGMLKKHHPLWMSIHCTHPDELTPEATRACTMLADAGIPLGSQTVLLKGVNDNAATITELMHRLLMIRVKPYYLFQADMTRGANHFRTRVETGIGIMQSLIGHTSGLAVPTFAIDAPGGGGKIPLTPNYLTSLGKTVTLKNYLGAPCGYHNDLD